MNAREVKDALAKRYPAKSVRNGYPMPGPYVVVEELFGIDVLAFAATGKDRGSWIGHEVKVSRSDFRSELLKPHKRESAVAECDRFYFVTPAGLLTPEEQTWEEPEWEPGDFSRTRCPNRCDRDKHRGERGFYHTDWDAPKHNRVQWRRCDDCEQRGYTQRSRVEREAPTLWIPKDVGLIEVSRRGTKIVREPLTHTDPPEHVTRRKMTEIVRWVSMRPDPRHEGLVETQRAEATKSREAGRAHRNAHQERLDRLAEKFSGSEDS